MSDYLPFVTYLFIFSKTCGYRSGEKSANGGGERLVHALFTVKGKKLWYNAAGGVSAGGALLWYERQIRGRGHRGLFGNRQQRSLLI